MQLLVLRHSNRRVWPSKDTIAIGASAWATSGVGVAELIGWVGVAEANELVGVAEAIGLVGPAETIKLVGVAELIGLVGAAKVIGSVGVAEEIGWVSVVVPGIHAHKTSTSARIQVFFDMYRDIAFTHQ